jgi:succinate-semialdehyde dehydrogenase/glutarate-semialdehyde dehydrogenase
MPDVLAPRNGGCSDVGRIFRVAEALEFGIVGIYEGLISSAVAPIRRRQAIRHRPRDSKYGIEEYLEMKYLALGGLGG